MLKTQQRFRSEKRNVYAEEINKIEMQSIDSIETFARGASKHLVCKKEEIKFKNIIKQYKNV